MRSKRQINIKHSEPLNDGSYGIPAKGWRRETHNRTELDVRDGYDAVQCPGEAHSNAHVDNCMLCLNQAWGFLAVKKD